MKTNEEIRLDENACRENNWERWGPYLSERQWATVREDYSAYGNCEAELTDVARTVCWALPIGGAGSVLQWLFGTVGTRL
jgi:hypothetical protein